MTKQSLISIVMPVYNAQKYLPECIDSIKKQTHQNWELIAVDDHSSDQSLNLLRHYAKYDQRISVYSNKRRLGPSSTANKAISKARSTWIARMDADDVMHPKRLEIQLSYLQKNPHLVVLGSSCRLINTTGKRIGYKTFPSNSKEIFNMLFWACPVQQPSIMVNASRLPKNFIWYDPKTKTGEEINFLIRISQYGQIANTPQILLNYRLHNHNLSANQNQKAVFYNLFKIRLKALIDRKYLPSPLSLLIGLAEFITVSIIPEKAILPTFQFVRGMKDLKFPLSSPISPRILRTK